MVLPIWSNWWIFVTRLLRNPAQIADFCAIFLHKAGLLCKVLSETFTFWTVRREISGPEREIPSPGILFSGLGILFSGPGRKNPGTETFSRRLRGRFSFPLELFSGHVSRVILSAESSDGLSRQPGFCAGSVPCSVKRAGLEGIPRHFDSRMARVAAFFPCCPGPAAGYANLRSENEQIVNAHPNVFILSMEGLCRGHRVEIRIMGTVPNLGDLTTDEYSFVIKCPASRHLPVRSKTPPPCRGGGSKSRRGFPPCHSARGGTKRP